MNTYAIRRDVRFFCTSGASKVCSLHYKVKKTYQRVLVDKCLWRQVQFRRYLPGNKLHHKSGCPPPKGLINEAKREEIFTRKRVFFSVFVAQQNTWNIPETGTINETTILGAASLGVSLNIAPFLGTSLQMPSEDVARTQEISRLRINVERAINKIANFHIGVVLSH